MSFDHPMRKSVIRIPPHYDPDPGHAVQSRSDSTGGWDMLHDAKEAAVPETDPVKLFYMRRLNAIDTWAATHPNADPDTYDDIVHNGKLRLVECIKAAEAEAEKGIFPSGFMASKAPMDLQNARKAVKERVVMEKRGRRDKTLLGRWLNKIA